MTKWNGQRSARRKEKKIYVSAPGKPMGNLDKISNALINSGKLHGNECYLIFISNFECFRFGRLVEPDNSMGIEASNMILRYIRHESMTVGKCMNWTMVKIGTLRKGLPRGDKQTMDHEISENELDSHRYSIFHNAAPSFSQHPQANRNPHWNACDCDRI